MPEREKLSESSEGKIERFRQAHGLREDAPAVQNLKREVELLESTGLKLLQVGKVREIYIVPGVTSMLDK